MTPLAACVPRCTQLSGRIGYVDFRRFLPFAIAFWTLFGLVIGIQVWISMRDHGHVVPWLLFYYLLVWVAWLGPTYAIAWLARRFPLEAPSRLSVALHVLAVKVDRKGPSVNSSHSGAL